MFNEIRDTVLISTKIRDQQLIKMTISLQEKSI